jgi:hypothetical protein
MVRWASKARGEGQRWKLSYQLEQIRNSFVGLIGLIVLLVDCRKAAGMEIAYEEGM